MKRRFGFKSVRSKMLVSFLAVLIIPVLVGTTGYLKLRQNMIEQAKNTYVDMLGQASNTVDGMYGELDNLTDALKSTQWVTKIAYMSGTGIDYTRLTHYDLSVYVAELANYKSLNTYIDRIMLAFPEKNVIMSMNGISTYEDFFNNYYKSSQIGLGQWQDMLSKFTDGVMLNPMVISNYDKKMSVLTYIRPINIPFGDSSPRGSTIVDSTPKAVLLLSIKEDGINKLLSGIADVNGASAYIIDGNEVIASRVAKGTDFTDSLATINSGSERVKSFRKGNTQYLAFTVKSKVNSWEYLAIVPQAAVMEPVNVPLYWAVLLFLVGIATSLVIAYILFWSNYKPLKTLVERLNGFFPAQRKEAEPQNEYSLIDQAFQHVVANENSLQNKLEFYYPMAVHSFFTKLLYETVAVADYQAVTKSLGIDLLQNTWTVAVLYSEDRSDDSTTGRSKAAKWQLGDLPVYSVEVDQNRYAIIINTAEQPLVAAAVNAVRADYAAGEGIRSIIGIGNPYEGLPHIGKSYREALCAVNYCANLDSPPNGAVYYRDIETNRTLGYRIPKDVEDELQKLLRAGDSQALKRYLDPFMDQSVRRVGAGQVSVQVFFYSLLSIALKAAANGELPMSSLIDEQRLMTMNSTAEVKSYISNVYMLVCESLHTEKHGHCQKIRSDILNFIDDNCLDDKLTLQSLADIFGVSVPYLSKFVKDQTGRNFLDYIAQKRVAIAKEMLRTGKYSIQQVGEQVGYANALTFRRVFKKIEGVNPGDYRDSIGNAG